jgi:hypothetical protein
VGISGQLILKRAVIGRFVTKHFYHHTVFHREEIDARIHVVTLAVEDLEDI